MVTTGPGLFDPAGRRRLVAGSSQGIGVARARGLAGPRAAAVLNGRDAGKLAAAAETPKNDGHDVAPLFVDGGIMASL